MTAGYIVATGFGGALLFFVLLWAFSGSAGDEAPWVPAGLAASVVMLLAVGVREVATRRTTVGHSVRSERWDAASGESKSPRPAGRNLTRNAAALRNLQKLTAESDASSSPELHLDAFNAYEEYLTGTEDILRSGEVSRESRAAMRSGQERARSMRRHHLLAWARGATRQITNDAQSRVRLSDKLETAMRAIKVVKSAQYHYPEEQELIESEAAILEFSASVKIAHWVELAQRLSFRGKYSRAIDRYYDALFYLSRETVREELRFETAEKIKLEIELLRAKLRTSEPGRNDSRSGKGRRRSENDRKTVPEVQEQKD